MISKNALAVVAAILALVAIIYFGSKKPEPAPDSDPSATTVVKPKPKPDKDQPDVYHRVDEGGKQGPEVNCKSIKAFAEGKSEAEVQALAKQYGVTVAVVKTWYICLN